MDDLIVLVMYINIRQAIYNCRCRNRNLSSHEPLQGVRGIFTWVMFFLIPGMCKITVGVASIQEIPPLDS